MFGIHVSVSFGQPKFKQGTIIMNHSDYAYLVSLIQDADKLEKQLIGDHGRTQEALKVLRRVKKINLMPEPPKVGNGPDV